MISNGSITISAAFVTSDGQKFHDLAPAQEHTRDQNLKARYSRLLRDDPKFAVVQLDMFIALMRAAATDAANILTEPLEPVSPKTGKPIERQAGSSRPVTVAEELGMGYTPARREPVDLVRPRTSVFPPVTEKTETGSFGEPMKPVERAELRESMDRAGRIPTDDQPQVNRDVAQRAAV